MKYMEKGGFQGHPLMRLTLYWTLVFLAGLWATNAFMFVSRLGLTPGSIAAHYLGRPEEFSYPRSAQSMLEVTHAHLPVMAVVVLLLTHLMIFSPYSQRLKRRFIIGTFLSALGGEAAGWLIRFVHPIYAWLKLLCFLTFETLLALLIFGLLAFLSGGKRSHPGRR